MLTDSHLTVRVRLSEGAAQHLCPHCAREGESVAAVCGPRVPGAAPAARLS